MLLQHFLTWNLRTRGESDRGAPNLCYNSQDVMEMVHFNCVLINWAVVKDIRAWALLSDHLSLNPSFVTYLLSDAGQANFFCFLSVRWG